MCFGWIYNDLGILLHSVTFCFLQNTVKKIKACLKKKNLNSKSFLFHGLFFDFGPQMKSLDTPNNKLVFSSLFSGVQFSQESLDMTEKGIPGNTDLGGEAQHQDHQDPQDHQHVLELTGSM